MLMPKNTSAYMSDFIYHVKDYEYASGYRGLAIALGSLVVFLSINQSIIQFLGVSIGLLNVDLYPLYSIIYISYSIPNEKYKWQKMMLCSTTANSTKIKNDVKHQAIGR